MGRGVSSGGGHSSLGYLFGGGEAAAPKPAATNVEAPPPKQTLAVTRAIPENPSAISQPAEATKQIVAGIQGSQKNKYFRADSQNTANCLTDRPSTKFHAAPGGGSSLGYLFGDGSK